LVVKVFAPDNVLVAEFDGPSAGPEYFTLETEQAGSYRVEVGPFKENGGEYSISLTVLEPIAKAGPARVDQLMATFTGDDVPGGVVGVIQEGEVLFGKGYGIPNLTHGIPFGVDTGSNLGSTSKQFTAFAIAMLDSQGALSFDDDECVSTSPSFPTSAR
jgi:CubicO group peptidase (beta-lactamase class C family)